MVGGDSLWDSPSPFLWELAIGVSPPRRPKAFAAGAGWKACRYSKGQDVAGQLSQRPQLLLKEHQIVSSLVEGFIRSRGNFKYCVRDVKPVSGNRWPLNNLVASSSSSVGFIFRLRWSCFTEKKTVSFTHKRLRTSLSVVLLFNWLGTKPQLLLKPTLRHLDLMVQYLEISGAFGTGVKFSHLSDLWFGEE